MTTFIHITSQSRICLLASAILFTMATQAAAQQSSPRTTPNKLKAAEKLGRGQQLRIVCFGDSVTGVYYHTGSRRAYTDMLGIALQRLHPNAKVKMINAGISGNTTANALARIDRDVLKHKPDLVTVMFGLNDMTRVPLEQYRANLQQIASKCRAIGAEVVFATPNNVINTSGRPTAKLIRYCNVVREVARKLETPLCDVYADLEAIRAKDEFAWKLLMSDAIHPNMDGHKQLAMSLAKTISGRKPSLDGIQPLPAIAQTLQLLKENKRVHILAMQPFDKLIEPALRYYFPKAQLVVESWPVNTTSLAKIEQDAKARVRKTKPNLVIIAVPRTAEAPNADAFATSFAWVMNWSLNFGPPTWDCIVVHPSVTSSTEPAKSHDSLVRQLVRAQDLHLLDRVPGSKSSSAEILQKWLKQQIDEVR